MDLEGQRHSQHPTGWRRQDEAIQDEACEVLWRNQKIDTTGVEVSVDTGVVTLSGVMDKEDSIQEALDCVGKVTGVIEVINSIRVK